MRLNNSMTGDREKTFGKEKVNQAIIWLVLIVASTTLPVLLWKWKPEFVSFTRTENQIFEFFAFFASVSIIGLTGWFLRKRISEGWRSQLKVIVPALVAFHFLFIFSEYSFKSWDYKRYELAAEAVVAGENPYGNGYLYPPMLVQSMAWEAKHFLGWGFDEKTSWDLVFYFHKCIQFLMLNLAFLLGYRMARSLGIEDWVALLLMASLLMLNAQVYRSLRYSQINLWVLNAFMLGIVLTRRYPVLGGVAGAVGGHLKLYPAFLVLPWLITRRWKAIVGFGAGVAILFLIMTRGGSDFHLWKLYIGFASQTDLSSTQFRDNSLFSLVHSFLTLGGCVESSDGIKSVVRYGSYLLIIIIFAWMGLRVYQRESLGKNIGASGDWKRFCGHAVDAVALSLLISPLVWAYHYVIAIPVVIWAWAGRGKREPWKVGLATSLMFIVPVFDIFPFSYNRITGLIILLVLTSPKKIPLAEEQEG